MPEPDSVLAGLTAIAREAWPVAAAWHLIIAAVGVAVALGWRPSRRAAGALFAIPLLSVAGFAAGYGNPFNSTVFALGALGLLGLAARLPRDPARRAPLLFSILGAGLLAFGWLYPHFLGDRSPVAYLYAAPMGLLPCPTLSAVIGLALLADGLRARGWSSLLAALGLFYGLFGALRLGVWIDLALTGGAIVLLARVWIPGRRTAKSSAPVS